MVMPDASEYERLLKEEAIRRRRIIEKPIKLPIPKDTEIHKFKYETNLNMRHKE